MCTVVFIPGQKDVYFASLRDESSVRPVAKAPEWYSINGITIISPIDALAGGTWLGINETGTVIILLNGGFEKHTVKKMYRKSRGLIVKELLGSMSPVSCWLALDLEEIEPFTLVIWTEGKLFQLVWDGEQKNKEVLDTTNAYIWSSATLYDKEAKTYRENRFKQWITQKPEGNPKSLLTFFTTEGDVENGFIINRNEQIKTQSYTFISIHNDTLGKMYYYDFISNIQNEKEIKLSNNKVDFSVTANH